MSAPDSGELDLAAILSPGDHLLVGSCAGEPLTLTQMLVEQRAALPPVRVLLGFTLTDTIRPEHLAELDVTVLGGYGRNASLVAAGSDVLPAHVSALPRLIESGRIPVDVLLVQCGPADRHGYYNLGVTTDVLLEAAARARVVVAEINDQMPRTAGDTRLPVDLVTHRVHTSRALPELEAGEPGPAEQRIAETVASLVPDGAVLQVGIGRAPAAAAQALHGHRGLGIHSGYLGDWMLDLVESGAVTNDRKAVDVDACVGGVLMGSQRLYAWADGNPLLSMRSARYTNAPDVLARHPQLVAINSAVEVDLTGQVNAEMVGGRYLGAVGGAVDFARAGAAAPQGHAILVLTSTAGRGSRSRIVSALDGSVTVGRADADVVVTEYGAVEVSGLPLRERARRLASVSHPRFRGELERAAEAL